MFDAVRRSFGLVGKHGVLEKSNFPADVGGTTTKYEYLHQNYYPTILCLPKLYPASSYSQRPLEADDPFNFVLHNINASSDALQKHSIEEFSSIRIDMARFAQMIAKIAHVYAIQHFGAEAFIPTCAQLILSDFPPQSIVKGHLENVGSLWTVTDHPSSNLHEIEVGRMRWADVNYFAVRVRLFANCNMPSYYVTVGREFE